jgi:hypothetical protein
MEWFTYMLNCMHCTLNGSILFRLLYFWWLWYTHKKSLYWPLLLNENTTSVLIFFYQYSKWHDLFLLASKFLYSHGARRTSIVNEIGHPMRRIMLNEHWIYVESSLNQRLNLNSTMVQCCFNVLCLLEYKEHLIIDIINGIENTNQRVGLRRIPMQDTGAGVQDEQACVTTCTGDTHRVPYSQIR